MKLKPTVVVVALGGILLAVALRSRREPASTAPRAETRVEAQARRYEEVEAAKRRDVERRDRLKKEVERLHAAEVELRARLGTTASAAPAAAVDPAEDRMEVLFRNMSRLEMERMLDALKARLGLSEEQEKGVRALLEKEIDESWKDGARDARFGDAERRARMAGLLTPAQMEEFDRYTQDERRRMEAAWARAEAALLTAELDLRPEQTKAAEEILKSDPFRGGGGAGDPGSAAEVDAWLDEIVKQGRRTASALQSLLDPPQLVKLEGYLKSREERYREMAGWMRIFAAQEPSRR